MPSCLKRRPAASTMRCLVACFWSLPYRIANPCRLTALDRAGSWWRPAIALWPYYDIMIIIQCHPGRTRRESDDDRSGTHGCGFERDVEDRADADHQRRRR